MFVVTVFIHDGKISNITLFSKTYKIRNRKISSVLYRYSSSSQPSSLMDTRLPQPKNFRGEASYAQGATLGEGGTTLDGGLAPKGLSPKILGLAVPQARKF